MLNNPVETNQLLKKLNLPGIANALPERNQEALANQLSYLEFLQLLLNDEVLLRDQRRYERRLQKANFKGQKTIENFDFNFNPNINQTIIRDLATCHFITEQFPVLIMGPCGTGKSHLAQALGQCAIQKGYDVVFTCTQKISDELQSAKAINRYTQKLKSWAKIALLIIDDFGLKPLRHPQDEDLHALIAERCETASTIFTSNLDLHEWQQAFSNQLLGVATVDRLRHHAYHVILQGKSYRSVSKKNDKKMLEHNES